MDISGKGLSGDSQSAAAHSESDTGSDSGVLELPSRVFFNALLAVCDVFSYSECSS